MNDPENKILLVDDDTLSRAFMQLMVRKAGYSVIEAKNGVEGLELFQRFAPALVLLDAQMPGMSGFDCCRKIRDLPDGGYVPVLMVTGLDDQASVDEAFLAGASDYVTKPVQMPVLIGRVGHLIRSAQAERSLRRSEEKYRSLINSLQEVIFQLDDNGHLVFVNPAWSQLMDYSVDSSLGKPFEAFLHTAEHRRHHAQFGRIRQQCHQALRYHSRCLSQNGKVRWVEIQLYTNLDKDEEGQNIAGRLHDITDRVIREQYRRLEYVITRILSHTDDPAIAIRRSMQAMCGSLGYQLGEFWQLDTAQRTLVCREQWALGLAPIKALADFTKTISLEVSQGIPGQTWAAEQPLWIKTLSHEYASAHTDAAQQAGFRSALSCPVPSYGIGQRGVIVLLSQTTTPPDQDLLRLLAILGQQFSQHLKRKQAEQQVQIQNRILHSELQEAASYVESLLPKDSERSPTDPDVGSRPLLKTLFQPSNTLGGDAFDYIWLDDDHLMLHLLDVAGHGVKSALLSVSVLNILRQHTLSGVDFYRPEKVLEALNSIFQVNEKGEDYFTFWYGVYDVAHQQLTFATAGHPPGILIAPTATGLETHCLGSDGIAIGLLPDFPFESKRVNVPAGSQLYLFSDGAFEVPVGNNGRIWGFEAWKAALRQHAEQQSGTLMPLLEHVRTINGSDALEDDFSILEVNFPPQ